MAGTHYRGSEIKNVDQFIDDSAGLSSEREKEIGQLSQTYIHISNIENQYPRLSNLYLVPIYFDQ